MTETSKQPFDPDVGIRKRILERAKAITTEILTRFSIAADDLENDQHRAALGALDGLDNQIQALRSLLRLIDF
jgi:hypothetical protein